MFILNDKCNIIIYITVLKSIRHKIIYKYKTLHAVSKYTKYIIAQIYQYVY